MSFRALCVVIAAGCGGGSESSEVAESSLSGDALRVRAMEVKRASDQIGINGLLVAGIGYHESGLRQCWSEATWSCPGPYSNDCGGPVLTGAYDGPCWWEQGGIGMFQLDSGTYSQTLAVHGSSVLEVAGNAQAGAGFIAYKVKVCPNTPVFASDQEVVDWINGAVPGTARFEEFLTAMAWCYNGCAPSFTGCSHTGMRENYRAGVQAMIDLLGHDFWTTPSDPTGCPYGDGLYCGGQRAGGDEGTLYQCTGGELSPVEECALGCFVAPPGEADRCAVSCEYGDGLYCGGNGVRGDPATLYRCAGGQRSRVRACDAGCERAPPGQDDACATTCPLGDGYYCGGNGVGGRDGSLYWCSAGQLSLVQVCDQGCNRAPPGEPDTCN